MQNAAAMLLRARPVGKIWKSTPTFSHEHFEKTSCQRRLLYGNARSVIDSSKRSGCPVGLTPSSPRHTLNGKLRPDRILFQSGMPPRLNRHRNMSASHAAGQPKQKPEDAGDQAEDVDVDDYIDSGIAPGYFGHFSLILPPEPIIFGVDHFKPARTVPHDIPHPPYAQFLLPEELRLQPDESQNVLKAEDVPNLRSAANLAKTTLWMLKPLIKAGLTTNEIDAAIHNYIISKGGYPSPLHYKGFPRSCCTSVNNIVAHGIPDNRPLEEGDILNVDVTVYLNGFHGDSSMMYRVGKVDGAADELIGLAYESINAAMLMCGPGLPFYSIGRAIAKVLPSNYSVSPQFTGHGIGRVFHSKPWVLHHLNNEPEIMKPGDCFTIEPCIVQGDDPTCWIFPDGWTASTVTGGRSAQVEHMILITDTDAIRLT